MNEESKIYEENEVIKVVHCGHVFFGKEFKIWIQYSKSCPTCRYSWEIHLPRTRSYSELSLSDDD